MSASIPPGPPSHRFGLPHLKRMRNDMLAFSRELARDYGDAVGLKIAGATVVQFSHPEFAEQVLVKQANCFRKPKVFDRAFRFWIGDGITINEGPSWTRRRKLVQAAMQTVTAESIVDSACRHVERLLGGRPAGPVELMDIMGRLAFSIVTEAALGPADGNEIDEGFRAACALQIVGARRTANLASPPLWAPTPQNRRVRADKAVLDRMVYSRLADPQRLQAGGGLLAALREVADDDGQKLTPLEARHEAITMMIGGKETGALSLLWTVYLLAQHPQVQEEAIAVVDKVLGGRRPNVADIGQLKLLECIYKEAIRLYPPVYTISRYCTEAVEIGPWRVPKRGFAMIASHLMHRDERWFPDPEAFRPERFAGGKEGHAQFAFLPFGAGKRVCIGARWALLQSVAAIAAMLQTCRFSLPADHQPPRLDCEVVLQPRGELVVLAEPRTPRYDVQRPALLKKAPPAVTA